MYVHIILINVKRDNEFQREQGHVGGVIGGREESNVLILQFQKLKS